MRQYRQASFFMILSTFFFALMNLLVRLSGNLPFMQKAFFRNFVAVFAAILLVLHEHIPCRVDRQQAKYLLLRAAFGTLGLICNFYAVDHMALADATILNRLAPFFGIIMSCFLLGEAISKTEMLLVLMAFVGALFVIKPTFSIEFIPALVGVLGGFGAGTAYSYIRKISKLNVAGPIIVLWFSVFSCLFVFPFAAARFVPMSTKQAGMLLGAGISAALGQFSVTAAYSRASVLDMAIFNNFQIIIAALLGFFILGQIPDQYSFLGYGIIIAAAVLKWNYDKCSSREYSAR